MRGADGTKGTQNRNVGEGNTSVFLTAGEFESAAVPLGLWGAEGMTGELSGSRVSARCKTSTADVTAGAR